MSSLPKLKPTRTTPPPRACKRCTVPGAALRLRLLCRMLRVGELLALAVILSWYTSRAPSAVLRLGGSLLLNPCFVFVLGNAIVLHLLALSRRDPSLSSSTNHSAAAQTSPTAPAAVSFASFTTQASPPAAAAAEAPAAAQVVVVPVVDPAAVAPMTPVFEEDKPAVRVVSKARAPRRSRSEKMGPRGTAMRAASSELRRSESDNWRRRRSSATARGVAESGSGRWAGMDDADEFRRTVEAFIAKQTRLHCEEESMTVVAVHGQVAAPAIGAGALAVVE